MKKVLPIVAIIFFLSLVVCCNPQPSNQKNNPLNEDASERTPPNEILEWKGNNVELPMTPEQVGNWKDKEGKRIKILEDKIIQRLEPELISTSEFENFKRKSNYVDVIKSYDQNNPQTFEILSYRNGIDYVSYYQLPTQPNTKQYLSNSFIFGDLNNDGKRDCIVTAIRADGYNEVHYLYVFINKGSSFKLDSVIDENKLTHLKTGLWYNLFRYQKIENGLLIGMSKVHYDDAHCCPSLHFLTKLKYDNGEFKLVNHEFLYDDYPYSPRQINFDEVYIQ